jgi:hypothetical protein
MGLFDFKIEIILPSHCRFGPPIVNGISLLTLKQTNLPTNYVPLFYFVAMAKGLFRMEKYKI